MHVAGGRRLGAHCRAPEGLDGGKRAHDRVLPRHPPGAERQARRHHRRQALHSTHACCGVGLLHQRAQHSMHMRINMPQHTFEAFVCKPAPGLVAYLSQRVPMQRYRSQKPEACILRTRCRIPTLLRIHTARRQHVRTSGMAATASATAVWK